METMMADSSTEYQKIRDLSMRANVKQMIRRMRHQVMLASPTHCVLTTVSKFLFSRVRKNR